VVASPYDPAKAEHSPSPASFEAPYGDSGRGTLSSRVGGSTSPSGAFEEANTNPRTPASRAARSAWSVPRTLTSTSTAGSSTEATTSVWAARCTTYSAPAQAARSAARSRTSPSITR
jgi:hypothetical protein